MRLRHFLASLPAALFAGEAIATVKPPQLEPPVRDWPWHHENGPVGLWAQTWNYDKKFWDEPHLVLREFDEFKDNPYQGMQLNNSRRNKYWGQSLRSHVFWNGLHDDGLDSKIIHCSVPGNVLMCFDRWETGIRFFKDAPNIDWSTVYPT